MKHQKTIIFLVVFTFLAFLPSLISFFTQSTSAQTNKSQIATVKNKTIPPSSRIRKRISGADKPNEIPDNVAYELFLRTVAEGNARVLVKRAGLTDEEVEAVMSEAYSLNSMLEISDRQAQELKNNRTATNILQTKATILRLQEKKDELLVNAVNRDLSGNLNDEAIGKLQDFIRTEVKGGIQKVFVTDDSVQTKEVAFVKTSATQQSGGQLYLYNTGWSDGTSLYGSGSISEQYVSNTSYCVTVTVTSPSGRSNTTQSDWGYATIINDTGLSLGLESGNYSVQSNFEEQLGYYDEYGNFYGTGGSSVGNLNNSTLVRPLISITAVDPAQFNFTNTMPVKTFTASIGLSADIGTLTLPIQITVEFNEQNNNGGVSYTVKPDTGINPPAGRIITVSNPSPGGTRPAGFIVEPTLNAATGTVINQFRISRVTRTVNGQIVELNPMTDFEYGTRVMNVSFTVPSPTPTPSPSPSPVASNCNPANVLLGWCFAGGGDWMYPPPSSQCGCSVPIEKSPILIDTQGNGFAMTNAANGVSFDLLGFGFPLQLSWTAPNSDDAWLALDRNQNNRIDNGKELFGNATQQPAPPEGEERQGFLALARYDKAANGGNNDGKITRSDAVFRKLRLWQDRNHNGISEAEELSRLPALDVVAVFLDYKESRRTDEFGNRFKYRAKVRDRQNANFGRWAWDVFLVSEP